MLFTPSPVTNCHTFSDPLPLERDVLYGRPLTCTYRKPTITSSNFTRRQTNLFYTIFSNPANSEAIKGFDQKLSRNTKEASNSLIQIY